MSHALPIPLRFPLCNHKRERTMEHEAADPESCPTSRPITAQAPSLFGVLAARHRHIAHHVRRFYPFSGRCAVPRGGASSLIDSQGEWKYAFKAGSGERGPSACRITGNSVHVRYDIGIRKGKSKLGGWERGNYNYTSRCESSTGQMYNSSTKMMYPSYGPNT